MEKLTCRNIEKFVQQHAEKTGKLSLLAFVAVFNGDQCQSCIKDLKELEKNFTDTIKFYSYDCTHDYYRMDKYRLVKLPIVYVFNKNGIIKTFEHYDNQITTKVLENLLK